jgi:hypothetical protein
VKKRSLLLAIVLVFSLVLPAFAAPIVLTFEGLGDFEAVQNYYNGGTGGNGSGPGPNYGIAFGADSLALISSTAGGSGNFTNAPSMPTVLFWLDGPGDVMNVAAGFDTGFSFFYSAAYAGSVEVYDGLNGTGTQLASLSLPVTPNDPNLPEFYNAWVSIGVAFSGIAHSAIFSGSADYIGFDNITLGSATPGNVPVPPTVWLLGSSLLGLVGWRRFRKD